LTIFKNKRKIAKVQRSFTGETLKKLTRIQAALVSDIHRAGRMIGKNKHVPDDVVSALVAWHFRQDISAHRVIRDVDEVDPRFIVKVDESHYLCGRLPRPTEIITQTPEPQILSFDELAKLIERVTGKKITVSEKSLLIPIGAKVDLTKTEQTTDQPKTVVPLSSIRKPHSRPGPKKPTKEYRADRYRIAHELLRLQTEKGGHFLSGEAMKTCEAIAPETDINRLLTALKKRGWLDRNGYKWFLTDLGRRIAENSPPDS